jgi:hypothetical protein
VCVETTLSSCEPLYSVSTPAAASLTGRSVELPMMIPPVTSLIG